MLTHAGQKTMLAGQFTQNKVGKTTLTPTMDIYRVNLQTGAILQVATAVAAFHIGDGIYGYIHTTTAGGEYYYFGTLKTSDTTVDLQWVPAVQITGIPFVERIDTTLSGLVATIAAAVWVASDRTLSSFGTLVTQITTAVWSAASRTLTQSAAAIAAALAGSTITAKRGDTVTISLTGLGNLSARTKLWFTAKGSLGDLDSASLIQIVEGVGLIYLNGAAGVAGQASITVTDAVTGALTITLSAILMAQLELRGGCHYDLQMLTATGVTTLTEGAFNVSGDVTRATT